MTYAARLLICFIVAGLTAAAASLSTGEPPPAARSPVLPIDFIENKGQWEHGTRFVARGGSVSARFERNSIVLRQPEGSSAEVALVFEGAAAAPRIAGETRRPGRYNFYSGSDPDAWHSNVPAWASVLYSGLYHGVDLRVREQAGRLEYDLILAPGIDAGRVVVRAEGVSSVDVWPDGTLLLYTSTGILRQTPPVTWEVLPDGSRRSAESRFRKIDDQRYGFIVTRHDPALPLVIDPGLQWSTFLGGSGQDPIGGVRAARNDSGDVFVATWSNSQDFAPGGSIPGSNNSAGVVRLNAAGTAVVYATFIGGWHSQLLYRALATNGAGEVVIGGETYSPDFPTTAGAFDTTRAGESSDGFVAKLGPQGQLVFSTFLGGANPDNVAAVAFGPGGSIIAGGHTSASDFPTTPGAYDPTYNAPNAPADGGAHGDWFIAELSADGSELKYGTYVGGPSIDSLEDLVVDPQGYVTAVGWVTGNNVRVFVSTPGAFDTTWNGTQDAAVARLKLDGAGAADLKYATLLGGSSDDNLWGVAFDPGNPQNVVVVGESWSENYPTTAGVLKPNNPAFSPLFPSLAGIMTRFTFPATGGTVAWSSYFGSEGFERAGEGITDVAISNTGEIIIAGRTQRSLFPTTRGAYDRTHAGMTDAFLSRISSNGATLLYSTFFGGLDDDTDAFLVTPLMDYVTGNTVLVAGATGSTDLEITPNAYDPTHGNGEAVGAVDGFVAKLALDADSSGDTTAEPPAPVRPIHGASFSGSGYITLEWTAVPDPSGIEAYEYQVSPKPDFPDGFIHYKGSRNATAVRLPNLGLVTWYWRVRTADRAGNLSAWSASSAFTLGASGGAVSVNSVGVFPANVVGGQAATGVVWLNGIAPSGGLVLTISKHQPVGFTFGASRNVPLPVTVPTTVNVPAGATQVEFPVTTSTVSSQVTVDVMASLGGVGQIGKISVAPSLVVTMNPLEFTPYQVVGGSPASAKVTLNAPAPADGLTLRVISRHPNYASVPPSVTVPAGDTSATFSITTFAVPTDVEAAFSVIAGSSETRGVLHVKPQLPTLTSLTLNSPVAGGAEATGTLTFSAPLPPIRWPAGGHGVKIRLSDPNAGGVISGGEWIAPGTTTHTFRLFTRGLPTTRTFTVTAALDRTTLSAPLTVTAAPAVSFTSVTLQPAAVNGGEGGIGRINLPAGPARPILVTLSSNVPGAVNHPSTVTISTGETSSMFAYTTAPRSTAASVTLTASFGSSSGSGVLTVNPSVSVTRIPLASLTLNPSTVAGGATSTGTVTLERAARPGGVPVQLASYNSAIASVPFSVTVPENATTATFPITTSATASNTGVIISGLADNTGWGKTAGLMVTAGGSSGPSLTALSLNPTSVAGGSSSTGTVMLSGAAPSGGAVVSLSDNSSSASVPANVTVPGGTTSTTFTVSTVAVTASTSASITATYAGVSRSASLSVTAAAGTTPAAPTLVSPSNGATGVVQPLTLDWNDVANAASYEVQVDSSSTIASPFVANPTVTTSQATLPTLTAGQTLWWRVRGRNSAGTAGAWSSTRSFTTQASGGTPPGGTATLTVTATGRSGQRITSAPAGINVTVGTTGSAPFTTGTSITLTVSNGREAIFTGACSSGGNKRKTCTFTLNANASVTANVQ